MAYIGQGLCTLASPSAFRCLPGEVPERASNQSVWCKPYSYGLHRFAFRERVWEREGIVILALLHGCRAQITEAGVVVLSWHPGVGLHQTSDFLAHFSAEGFDGVQIGGHVAVVNVDRHVPQRFSQRQFGEPGFAGRMCQW